MRAAMGNKAIDFVAVNDLTNAATLAHLFDDERIRRIQHHRIHAMFGLERFEPGVDILGRQFGFQAFEAAGPGIHRGQQSVLLEGVHAAQRNLCRTRVKYSQSHYHAVPRGIFPSAPRTGASRRTPGPSCG